MNESFLFFEMVTLLVVVGVIIGVVGVLTFFDER
jgi:uncharacterized membrane protein